MPGTDWHKEIEKAISTAQIVILLISKDYLSSAFIQEIELPRIVELSNNNKVLVYQLILSPCNLEHTCLSKFKSVNDPTKPLNSLTTDEQAKYLKKLTELIIKKVAPKAQPSKPSMLQITKADESDLHVNVFFKADLALKVKDRIK